MRSGLLGAFLFVAILAGIVSAVLPPPGGTPPGSPPPSTLPANCGSSFSFSSANATLTGFEISLLALVISFDVIAVAYIINRLVPTSGIGGWINTEYWEIAKSAMLIVGIYAILLFVSNIALLLSPVPVPAYGSPDSLQNSINGLSYLSQRYLFGVDNQLCTSFRAIGDIAAGIGIAKGFTISFYFPIPIFWPPIWGGEAFLFGVQYNPYASLFLDSGNIIIGPYVSIVRDVVYFVLFPLGATVFALENMLPALITLGLVAIIPLGIIFRAFPFIRGVGGTLVAIGIGLSIIFPSLLVLFNTPVTNFVQANITPPPLSSISCTSIIGPLVGGSIPATIMKNILCYGTPFILTQLPIFSNAATALPWVWRSFGTMYPYLNFIISYTVYAVIQLLLFTIDLIIMYPLVDNIARALGGTIRLTLGGKLRLAT